MKVTHVPVETVARIIPMEVLDYSHGEWVCQG